MNDDDVQRADTTGREAAAEGAASSFRRPERPARPVGDPHAVVDPHAGDATSVNGTDAIAPISEIGRAHV